VPRSRDPGGLPLPTLQHVPGYRQSTRSNSSTVSPTPEASARVLLGSFEKRRTEQQAGNEQNQAHAHEQPRCSGAWGARLGAPPFAPDPRLERPIWARAAHLARGERPPDSRCASHPARRAERPVRSRAPVEGWTLSAAPAVAMSVLSSAAPTKLAIEAVDSWHHLLPGVTGILWIRHYRACGRGRSIRSAVRR